jgi:hypothetical protein
VEEFDIEHTETMSDAELSAAIAEKPRAAGMNLDLKVENGRITVERKSACAGRSSGRPVPC